MSPMANAPDLRAIAGDLADRLIERGLTLFEVERIAKLMVHAARLGGAPPWPVPRGDEQ